MDEVALEFEPGFTVVTGETGAGKSVLLGALALLAGNRVEKTIISKGSDSCEVQASLYFENSSAIDELLLELSLPVCEEGTLVLRRSVERSKSGRVQINGALATLSALQSLGEGWIDFHGPGEPQKLFKERYQLAMLDLYAQNQTALIAYQQSYRHWQELLDRAKVLEGNERLSTDEIVFAENQINAIDRLELSLDSVQELERDFNRLDKAREIVQAAEQIGQGLQGDAGILEQLSGLSRLSQQLAAMDADGSALNERLHSLMIEMEDLAAEYEQLSRSIDMDEDAAAAIQERMTQWLELKRKYGSDVNTVLAKRATLAERIEAQSDIEGKLQAIYAEAGAVEKNLQIQADKITQKRSKAALQLAKQSQQLLGKLGFKQAVLKILIHTEASLKETGNSYCQFLFSANAGQDPLPLNKIASSGETARVMLALKAVLAQVDATPVLVFDEVDANVGGEIGAVVGHELQRLAGDHQVFCVTHLPQVAAQGRQHYVVSKSQSKTATTVRIEKIPAKGTEREAELARMLGDRSSKAAIEHARELLS